MNFTQMARCGRSCESRFRQNFKKSFDWMTFNKHFVNTRSKDRIAIAINPCFVPKSGKKTPGLDWFWSGCASAMKRGLEFLGLSVIDADASAYCIFSMNLFQRLRKAGTRWNEFYQSMRSKPFVCSPRSLFYKFNFKGNVAKNLLP